MERILREMTGRELFEIWAPSSSVWSRWVSPALFAQIQCGKEPPEADPCGPDFAWHESVASADGAVIVALPGADSFRLAFVLAGHGYRPVPIINASPGPLPPYCGLFPHSAVALDMSSLIKEVCHGTQRVQRLA